MGNEPTANRRTPTNRAPVEINRRRLLKAGIATTTIATSGCVSGLGSTRMRRDEWEEFTLNEQLNVVHDTIRPFTELETMAEANYINTIPLTCGLGYHFDNFAKWDSPGLDPGNPESLIYVLDEAGKLTLGGCEFILVTDLDDNGDPILPKPDLFNDEGEPLDEAPLLGTSEADGWELVVDPESGRVIWVLHVWVHEPNPGGVFHPQNPRYDDMPGCNSLE